MLKNKIDVETIFTLKLQVNFIYYYQLQVTHWFNLKYWNIFINSVVIKTILLLSCTGYKELVELAVSNTKVRALISSKCILIKHITGMPCNFIHITFMYVLQTISVKSINAFLLAGCSWHYSVTNHIFSNVLIVQL